MSLGAGPLALGCTVRHGRRKRVFATCRIERFSPAWLKAKESDLAAITEREIDGTGWLPGCCAGPSREPGAATAVYHQMLPLNMAFHVNADYPLGVAYAINSEPKLSAPTATVMAMWTPFCGTMDHSLT